MTPRAEPVPLPGGGALPAVWLGPRDPHAVVVLAHGAGAGMSHPFMCAVHEGLAAGGCLAVKFDFPYMAAGRTARRCWRRPGGRCWTRRACAPAARR